ncbi:MAG: glycosyltransferase family 4 protein [Nitrospinae bacterium]|nr:glycosyltransferase family 4 protein [Nitrospinota bacterium]
MSASPSPGFFPAAIAALCFLLTLAGTGLYRRNAVAKSVLMDIPNDRSSHTVSTPRGGGIVFVAVWAALMAALAGGGLIPSGVALTLLPPALFAAAIGFADDLLTLPATMRFVLQIAAALLFLQGIGGYPAIQMGPWHLDVGIAGGIFAVLWIVWSINLFNFMDGVDGIASVEAMMVLAAGGFFLAAGGGAMYGAAAFWAATAVTGFLVWNLSKARIFMGDAGSYFLGFFIAALALLGERFFNVPLLLWVILYGVFWFDATATLLRRAAAGERWYAGHRSHAYQRLQQAGFSHATVSGLTATVNIVLIALATAAFFNRGWLLACFAAAVAVLSLAYFLVEKRRPMFPPGR